ncbi:hypothetical protein [Dyadobacter frigoris]|uniref:Uncharacterized protein n=1 Tax=Dyadobacter frigoris TaxID=2576211 RepID=A0A4U6CSS1_9BACT|nr:hypothetical protein [Dyadobacter frigoris]TKT87632.1 hypothetical protein FDK13_29020 [Dyadobacter frigoris]GLU52693.1 hypothetical protein Dfri01_21540 [Dyadobacter frigoris]
MKPQSNIFVYIELDKLVENLTLNPLRSKQYLKSQAGRFGLIPIRYFSAKLSGEWLNITKTLNISEPNRHNKIKNTRNAAVDSIDQMSPQECQELTLKICDLFEKVKLEFM